MFVYEGRLERFHFVRQKCIELLQFYNEFSSLLDVSFSTVQYLQKI